MRDILDLTAVLSFQSCVNIGDEEMGWKTMDANKTRFINAKIFVPLNQFQQHFMSSFFANFVLAKNNKHKL